MRYLSLILACLVVQSVQAAQEMTWEATSSQQTHYQSVSPENKALLTEIYVYEVAMQSRQLSPMEMNGYSQRVALAEKLGLNVRALIAERPKGQHEGHSANH